VNDNCSCGHIFRTAEDYRDHLPCPGHPVMVDTVKAIVDWLRSEDSYGQYSIEGQWVANAIERGDWKK
jgi:hypothetical protein